MYFLFSWIFLVGYKKDNGKSFFDNGYSKLTVRIEKNKEVAEFKEIDTVEDIDKSSTIKFDSAPVMGLKTTIILISLGLVVSAIFYFGGNPVPFRLIVILFIIVLFGNICCKRLEFANKLNAYSKTFLIAGLPIKYRWYYLPPLAEFKITKNISNRSTVMFPVKVGSARSTIYHVLLAFTTTKEMLHVYSSSEESKAKKQLEFMNKKLSLYAA